MLSDIILDESVVALNFNQCEWIMMHLNHDDVPNLHLQYSDIVFLARIGDRIRAKITDSFIMKIQTDSATRKSANRFSQGML